jgi:two-component system, NarL family, nitrate/nitrite response regulator NarL
MSLRVRLIAPDPIRRHGLTAMLAESGHSVVTESPDVVLCDAGAAAVPPPEAEAPVVALTDRMPSDPPAGVLPREVTAAWLDLALRAAAAGLLIRAPGLAHEEPVGFAAAPEESPLTPRETEVLRLIAQGFGNKAVARQLNISVHTVKFHLESLFARLGVTNRAEAVAKGLTGGVIEL